MDVYPVTVGGMLFTMVDPQVGHELAYNRWYERDHFYGGVLTGPHTLAGARWVATRTLKDLRFPEKSPFAEPVDAGSYLAIYWYEGGKVAEHTAWASQQVWRLYENGRGFHERTHAHTGVYDFDSVRYRDDDGVPIELALDHRYPGLAVVVVEPAAGIGRAELSSWLRSDAISPPSAADIVSSWTVRTDPRQATGGAAPMPLGADGGSLDRIVQLVFLASGPVAAWGTVRDYTSAIDAGGYGRVSFAAPFQPTVVGTDTYTDELW
jgi:hypothetical protein